MIRKQLFIIVLLVATLFFGFMSTPVMAWDSEQITDWEDYPAGATSGSADFYNWARTSGDEAEIEVYTVNDSTKAISFDITGDGSGSANNDEFDRLGINFNYGNGMFLNRTRLYFDLKLWNSLGGEHNRITINFKRNSVSQHRLYIVNGEWRGSEHNDYLYNIWVINSNGTYINILNWSTVDDGYKPFYIDIDYIDETAWGSRFYYNVTWTGNSTLWGSVKDTFVIWQGTADYFDELDISSNGDTTTDNRNIIEGYLGRIHIRQTGYTGTGTNFPIADEWDYIGSLDYTGTTLVEDEPYLEIRRYVPMTIELHALDLWVGSEVYNGDNNVSNYWLTFCGNTTFLDNPVAFIPYDYGYLLRWYNINKTLTDEYPVFNFYHSEILSGTSNTYWFNIYTTVDHDNDGEIGYRHHDENLLFDCSYEGSFEPYDLLYRMYYTGEIYEPPQDYDDYIDTDKNNYELYEEIVHITYTVDTLISQNRIVVKNDAGWEIYNETTDSQTGNIFLMPNATGSFYAYIYRSSVIQETAWFNVTGLEQDYYIYTVPNPTKPYVDFKVFFHYNYSEIPCSILLYELGNSIHLEKWDFQDVPITSNFSIDGLTEGIYTFKLMYRIWNNDSTEWDYFLLKPRQHIVKPDYDNRLEVNDTNIPLGETLRFYGVHNYLGSSVYIEINEIEEIYVGDKSYITKLYEPQFAGDYNATLILKMSDSEIILDYVTFSVSGADPDTEPEVDAWSFLGDFKEIFGILIVVIFIIIPLAISGQTGIDAPLIVYLGTGTCGVALCTSIGLFDTWVVLIVVVGLFAGMIYAIFGRG